MRKIIEFLVYTFTNRLTKVISFHLTNGIPYSQEEVDRIKGDLSKRYGENIVLFFDDTEKGTTIT